MPKVTRPKETDTRKTLIEAAILLMRRHGYAATSVDRICTEARVTKGAFFHYFRSKEDIARAAVEGWCQSRAAGYREDIGDPAVDPLVRLDRLIDGLVTSVRQPPDGMMVCLLGMISQELSGTNAPLRQTCSQALAGWTGFVSGLLREAKEAHRPRIDFDPDEISWFLNSLWQGSLLIAKTRENAEIVAQSFDHARTYIESLFAKA